MSATTDAIAAAIAGLGVGKVLARGVFTVAGGVCAWIVGANHGFAAAAPVYNGVGDFTVTLAPVPGVGAIPFAFCHGSGDGQVRQDGPAVAGAINIRAVTYEGADSNPAGWAPGSVLGAPVAYDPATVVLLVIDYS